MGYGIEKDITVLAGDIGGTKTELAVYSSQTGLRRPLVKEKFPIRDYSGLEAIIEKFLSKHDILINRASFGVAGPVVGRRAHRFRARRHGAKRTACVSGKPL
jgi:glucokinase